MTYSSREIRLASRPHGWPTDEHFSLATVEVDEPSEGHIIVRNTAMSVDPYMRGRMNETKSYVPPFEVGEVLSGDAVGEVIASAADGISVGDWVVHGLGWREVAVVPAHRATVIDVSQVSPTSYLGVLGMPGLTAYVGLTTIADLQSEDIVFISGAAGAVGSIAGQLAGLLGASRVVGSAGSPQKVSYLLDELGFDAAFDYHDGPVAKQLGSASPEGIDVYFDNVGGEHLEAAILRMRNFGRIACCGSISGYNAIEPPPGPRTIGLLTPRRISMRGFIVFDHPDRRPEYLQRATGWIAEGLLTWRETRVEGIDRAPEAFLGMLRGDNIGKMIVTL